jgi:hypothetical protein
MELSAAVVLEMDQQVGRRITPALEDARPLAKNWYKVPLTRAVVKQTLLSLAAGA